ncbi:hypothetical protein B0H67DRAFT_25463 [Lasiosphaeris hirsuta]|uniref:Uncharacterized protein n=1 Tax=Lasiosphaeris hirsuta TaxID=260670 RepID=A0AA40BA07_9PEZI|nr:hypothetical protein B0H67DRAFT_25463 [Lasiosphaeris hirsuta]
MRCNMAHHLEITLGLGRHWVITAKRVNQTKKTLRKLPITCGSVSSLIPSCESRWKPEKLRQSCSRLSKRWAELLGLDTSKLPQDSEDFGAYAYNGAIKPWDELPEPKHPPRRSKAATRAALAQVGPMPIPKSLVRLDIRNNETRVWTKYHAYQGFISLNHGRERCKFRAIPTPKKRSLWHSIAYHTAGRNMMRHYEVKARIWTYFAQVLQHSEYFRWREFVWLEYNKLPSEKEADSRNASVQVSGQVGILRHLHRNEKIHEALHKLSTSAAEIPPRNILYVIADYYAAQIIVFQCLTSVINPEEAHGNPIYTAFLFGFMEDSTPRKQIFLVTTDWRRFSPVNWADGDGRPVNAAGVPWFQPHANVLPKKRKRKGGEFPSPWWDKDSGVPEEDLLRQVEIPPFRYPQFAGKAREDPGLHVWPDTELGWEPDAQSKLTQEVLTRFRLRLDIPGNNLSNMPTPEWVSSWDHPIEHDKWNIGRDGRGQIRFGGGARMLGVTEYPKPEYPKFLDMLDGVFALGGSDDDLA